MINLFVIFVEVV